MITLAKAGPGASMTISELSEAEDISKANTGKIMRILREAKLVTSVRGHVGGYSLAHPPGEIDVGTILAALGGRLVDDDFCSRFAGIKDICAHSPDCTVKSLWNALQTAVDGILQNIALEDLITKKRLRRDQFDTSKLLEGRAFEEIPATEENEALLG